MHDTTWRALDAVGGQTPGGLEESKDGETLPPLEGASGKDLAVSLPG